jgi:hypothetical protein
MTDLNATAVLTAHHLPVDLNTTDEGLRVNMHVIPLAKIHPNPWNPNKQDDPTFQALEESLSEFGDFDPITVRAHPELEGEYQIVDGEHRHRARTAKGYKFALANVLDLSDDEARKLTAVTLEDRGRPDKILLAKLLSELDDNGVDLETSLPYDPSELEELLKLAQTDWEGEYERKQEQKEPSAPPPPSKEPPAAPGEWVTFTARMTFEDHQAFLDAYKLIHDGTKLSDKVEIANGQVIHSLAAEYLAGANYARDEGDEEDRENPND